MLLDTRAAGSHILPLDGVFADLNDEAGLIADSRLSARLGYIGRTVIHPKQIAPVKGAYAVPEAEVAYYQKVVVEFAAAEKAGTAAIAVDGKLVDYAMAQRARRVLELASLDRRGEPWIFLSRRTRRRCGRTSKELLDHVCPPEYAERCDNEAQPPREAYQALAKHGWFGLAIPAEYGGTGGSAIDLAILLEETGRHFEELAMWLFRTLTYGGYAVLQRRHAGAEAATLLPKIARGELSFCFGLTEPDSGSDAAALTTRAKAIDGGL